jgi:capsular exopolysaccharide synthesis family protein
MAETTTPKAPPIPAAADRDEDEVIQRRTFRDYYIILRERVWIALPLALLVSVSVGYYQARQPAMYSASATMQFEKPETVVTTQGVVDESVHTEFDINTYIQDLLSNKIRQMVIDSFTADQQQVLLKAAMKKAPPGTPAPPIGALIGGVSVDKITGSFLIRISDSNSDPDAAALVANQYVKVFMDYLIQNEGGENDFAVGFLQQRADELQKQSEEAEAALDRYMRDHHLVSLDKSLDLVSQALEAAHSSLTSAQLDLLRLQDIAAQVADYQANHKNLLDISYIASHGSVASLRAQLENLQQQQAELSLRYLERHPKMIAIDDQISTVQNQLKLEIAQAIADLNTSLNAAQETVKSLQREYADQEQAELQLKSLSVQYDSLLNQRDAAKANYASILDRLNQTQTTRSLNLEKIPLHPLDSAIAPGAPYQPNPTRIVRTCTGLGVIVFLGVALGLSFIDDRIKSAWDVEAFIGVGLLGIIPDLSTLKGEDKHTLVLNHQQAPGVEAFLGIYSSVKIQSKLDYPKSILVTSTIPGEGKTLVSSNLAGCFARHGKRTLLIDCDLRRPMLHRHFKQPNNVGLITWFESGASLDGDLTTNAQLGIVKIGENFSLLGSGGRSKSPTGLLESPTFAQLIERLQKQFDVIIIDSPPMGAVTDALLIAERTDEVIYVCRFNRAYRKHIKLYIRALLNGKNAVLGIVLNGLSPRRIEYYSNYRYYRSYKKYYGAQT